ncbi:MAG: hypothetical protein ACK4WC_14240 [Rubrimonas sp.]
MSVPAKPNLARLTAALAALSMVLVLAVHAPHRAYDSRLSADLATLGLTFADLCADRDSEGPAQPPECPACILAKALGLVSVQADLLAVSILVPAASPPREVRVTAGFLAQAPPARGPPVDLV